MNGGSFSVFLFHGFLYVLFAECCLDALKRVNKVINFVYTLHKK